MDSCGPGRALVYGPAAMAPRTCGRTVGPVQVDGPARLREDLNLVGSHEARDRHHHRSLDARAKVFGKRIPGEQAAGDRGQDQGQRRRAAGEESPVCAEEMPRGAQHAGIAIAGLFPRR